MAMTRVDLQRLAQIKFDDSVLLLANQRYCNAYYLAGYAVEMALKACIARQIRQEEIPDKALIEKVFTHEYSKLVGLSGLSAELKNAQDSDHQFQAYWGITAEWKPNDRYAIIDPTSAELLLTAIGDPEHGVLRWIKMHW
jgi:hypothetical protein